MEVATEYLPLTPVMRSSLVPYRVGDLELGALDSCGTFSGDVVFCLFSGAVESRVGDFCGDLLFLWKAFTGDLLRDLGLLSLVASLGGPCLGDPKSVVLEPWELPGLLFDRILAAYNGELFFVGEADDISELGLLLIVADRESVSLPSGMSDTVVESSCCCKSWALDKLPTVVERPEWLGLECCGIFETRDEFDSKFACLNALLMPEFAESLFSDSSSFTLMECRLFDRYEMGSLDGRETNTDVRLDKRVLLDADCVEGLL